jgi:hypothetical protein
MAVPRRIFALWLQGESKAPPLVKMCLRRWRRLNPDHEVRVLDLVDTKRLLRGFPIDCDEMRPQALSDAVRVKLLRDEGGVWVDATAFPVRPLDTWLPEAASSGFFAFQGHKRPIDVDSWFLAAAPGNIIPRLWWQDIERYWHKPRKLIEVPTHDGRYNYDFDPLEFFGSDESRGADDYPYFWVMYMFTRLMGTNDDLRSAWEAVPKKSGSECHAVQDACDRDPTVSDRELVALSLATDVQKLSYKGPHKERWLTLDRSFMDVDRLNSVDPGQYGYDIFRLPLSERVAGATVGRARSLGGKVARRVRRAVVARTPEQ